MKQIDKISVGSQLLVNKWLSDYLINNMKSLQQQKKEACVFLDIDGTIIQNNHYLAKTCVLFVHNIFRKCNELGIHVFVITARIGSYSARTQTILELEECGYFHQNKKSVLSSSSRNSRGVSYYDELIMMSQSDVNEFQQTINNYHRQIQIHKESQEKEQQMIDYSALLMPSYNFSLYKYRARSGIAKLKGYVALLTIGDQWYDILYVPSGEHFARLTTAKKNELLQIMTTLNHEDDSSMYICTGLDHIASLVGIKLPLKGLSTF